MRPIIPFITIQAIYLSALMRVLFRFASSTEQGIKLTKEKCGLCALITDNVLLAIICLLLLYISDKSAFCGQTSQSFYICNYYLVFPFYILLEFRDFAE